MCINEGANTGDKTRYEDLTPEERSVWDVWEQYAKEIGFEKEDPEDSSKEPAEKGFSVYWQLGEIGADGFSDILCALLGSREKQVSLWEQCEDPEIDREIYDKLSKDFLDHDGKNGLNDSQSEAIEKALRNPITFIQGPPGTGKTYTICHLMAKIAASGKTAAIISNNSAAIDTIEEKLTNQFCNLYEKTAKLGNKNVRGKFSEERGDKAFQFCSPSGKRRETNVVSEPFLEKYPLVLSTIHSLRTLFKDSKGLKYDYVIIDETSQVPVMLGFLAASCAKHLVLVGDEEQLHAFYDKDAIKDAIKDDNYDHIEKWRLPKGLESFYGFAWNALGKQNKEKTEVFLAEHYRCHPGIIRFCKEHVYDKLEGKNLKICTKDYDTSTDCPITVFYYNGEYDERCSIETSDEDSKKGSKHNMRQIQILKHILEAKPGDDLYDHFDELNASKNAVSFLTPFRGQQKEIKDLLESLSEEPTEEMICGDNGDNEDNEDNEEEKKLKDIPKFLTIHKSQGKEWDRVYFLPVEDGDWEWPWSQKKNMINVMASRAKRELIIITSTRLMSKTLQEKLTKQYIPPRHESWQKTEEEMSEEERQAWEKRKEGERFLQELLDYAWDNGGRFVDVKVHSIFDSAPVVKAFQNDGKDLKRISVPELCFYDELKKYMGKTLGSDYEKDNIRIYREANIGACIDDIDDFINKELNNDVKINDLINKLNELQETEKGIIQRVNDTLKEKGYKKGLKGRDTIDLDDFTLRGFIEKARYDFIVCDSDDEVKLIIEIQGAPHRYLDDLGAHNKLNEYLKEIDEEAVVNERDNLRIQHNQLRDDLKKIITSKLIAKRRYLSLSNDGSIWDLHENGEMDSKLVHEKLTTQSKKHLVYHREKGGKINDDTKTIEKVYRDFQAWKKEKNYL